MASEYGLIWVLNIMSKDFTSGAEPEQLRQLFSLGLGETHSEQQIDRTASLDIFMEKPGGRIGRYKMLSVLGEGGMGVVYLAQQHQPMKRHVAVKIIKPGMDSKRVIARFEAERQALALLDHPTIAHVYDAVTTETGRPYFVMEFIKGLSITEHCDHHKLTIEERIRLFQQVCQAVQHAHQKGIIHRDIKPSNILVSTQDDQAVPKIIDFGVAKALAQPLTERTLATEDSQLLGTPEYMSPEQADMATEDIDTRSDIYSLGVLLYVLLTGVLPFDSDTLREGGIENIRKTIRETDPKTPSTRLSSLGEEAKTVAENRRTEIGALAKHLRKELEWIPLKAMRRDRAERYRSASELDDDIDNFLKGKPLMAGPPTASYRLRKFLRRHKALVCGVAAVLVVSLIGTIVSMTFAMGQARALAEAEAVSDLLQNDLIASVSPETSSDRKLTISSFLEVVSESVGVKLKDMPLREASIRFTLGWTYRMLGELEAAEPHLERALQIYQEQLGTEHTETLDSMGCLGWVYWGQGRLEEAKRLWAKKLEICRRVFGDRHPMTLASMNDLAIAYKGLGRYDEAEQLYLEGLENSRDVLDEQNETHRFIGNLGQVYEKQGRYDEAKALYIQSIEMKRRVLGEQHPYTLYFMSFLARIYRQQERYDEAESLYLKTLEFKRHVLGEHHSWTLESVKGLARVYMDRARYEQAEKLLVEALEHLQNVRGKVHRDTLDLMNDLAVLYKEQGDFNRAELLLLQAVEGRRLKLSNTHPHTLESWKNLIELYEAWNKPEKAKEWRSKLPKTEALDK